MDETGRWRHPKRRGASADAQLGTVLTIVGSVFGITGLVFILFVCVDGGACVAKTSGYSRRTNGGRKAGRRGSRSRSKTGSGAFSGTSGGGGEGWDSDVDGWEGLDGGGNSSGFEEDARRMKGRQDMQDRKALGGRGRRAVGPDGGSAAGRGSMAGSGGGLFGLIGATTETVSTGFIAASRVAMYPVRSLFPGNRAGKVGGGGLRRLGGTAASSTTRTGSGSFGVGLNGVVGAFPSRVGGSDAGQTLRNRPSRPV